MLNRFLSRFLVGFLAGTVWLFALSGQANAAGDANRGAKLYEDKCTGCHSLDANRIGPAHRGVYGRKAGLAPGFNYSPGLKKSTIIWGDASLGKWLTNPQGTIPGARMGFRLGDAAQRADVIAFLKRESAKKKK